MFVNPVERLKSRHYILDQYATIFNQQYFLSGKRRISRDLELRIFKIIKDDGFATFFIFVMVNRK